MKLASRKMAKLRKTVKYGIERTQSFIYTYIKSRVGAMAVAEESDTAVVMKFTMNSYAADDPQVKCYYCNAHLFPLVCYENW